MNIHYTQSRLEGIPGPTTPKAIFEHIFLLNLSLHNTEVSRRPYLLLKVNTFPKTIISIRPRVEYFYLRILTKSGR